MPGYWSPGRRFGRRRWKSHDRGHTSRYCPLMVGRSFRSGPVYGGTGAEPRGEWLWMGTESNLCWKGGWGGTVEGYSTGSLSDVAKYEYVVAGHKQGWPTNGRQGVGDWVANA